MEKTAAPQIYGADEIDAIVLDPGSYTTQVGYAGNDQPSLILPSYYGKSNDELIFDENVMFSNSKSNLTINSIISNNIIHDWEIFTKQYEYFKEKLEIDPSTQPLLLTESSFNNYNNKLKSMEYFFETENYCAMYTVKQPTCVSFAHGRPNCLIVDIGHDLTTVTPIIDGLCLRNQVRATKYAGNFLNMQLKSFLNEKSLTYIPQFQISNKSKTYWGDHDQAIFTLKKFDNPIDQSVIDFSYLRTLREMKELLLECTMDDEIEKNDITNEVESEETRWFELPNGQNIPFTQFERQKLSNSLFNPDDLLTREVIENYENPFTGKISEIFEIQKNEITNKDYIPLRRSTGKKNEDDEEEEGGDNNNNNNNNNDNTQGDIIPKDDSNGNSTTTDKPVGLTKLIQNVLDNLDIDLKPQLANNIVLTGSSTLIPRLNERLNNELVLNNPSLKIRVHSAGNSIERKYASWIGGSILSSLGTFHQLWVSKAEYEEVGPDQLIINRFR